MPSQPDRPLAPGGETWHQFLARIEDYIAERGSAGSSQQRWIFTHAGFMVWLVRCLIGATDTRLRLELENCSMLVFDVAENRWTLQSYLPLTVSGIL